jgi:hypothetical protein
MFDLVFASERYRCRAIFTHADLEMTIKPTCLDQVRVLHPTDDGVEPFFPSAGLPNDDKTSQMGRPLQRRPKHMAVCREAQTRGVKCAGCPQMSAHPHEKAKRAGAGETTTHPNLDEMASVMGTYFVLPAV